MKSHARHYPMANPNCSQRKNGRASCPTVFRILLFRSVFYVLLFVHIGFQGFARLKCRRFARRGGNRLPRLRVLAHPSCAIPNLKCPEFRNRNSIPGDQFLSNDVENCIDQGIRVFFGAVIIPIQPTSQFCLCHKFFTPSGLYGSSGSTKICVSAMHPILYYKSANRLCQAFSQKLLFVGFSGLFCIFYSKKREVHHFFARFCLCTAHCPSCAAAP